MFHNAQTIVEGIDTGTLVIPPPSPDIADIPIIGKPLSELWQLASLNLEALISQFKTQIVEFSKTLLLQATNISLILLKFIISIVVAVILTLNAKSLNQGVTLFVLRLAPTRGEEFIQLATTSTHCDYFTGGNWRNYCPRDSRFICRSCNLDSRL